MNENNRFYGIKCSESVYASHPGYRDFMIALEFDKTVVSYFQPNVEIMLNFEMIRSKPLFIDFWVKRSDGREEFVYIHDQVIDPHTMVASIQRTSSLNVFFTPVHINKINLEPRRRNLEMLWTYANIQIQHNHKNAIKNFFKGVQFPNIRALKRYFERNSLKKDLIYTMIFHQQILVNLDNFIITDESQIMCNLKNENKCRETQAITFFEFEETPLNNPYTDDEDNSVSDSDIIF